LICERHEHDEGGARLSTSKDQGMAKVNWANAVDIARAVSNLRNEMVGDWHQDPWGWPELGFILKKAPDLIYGNCASTGCRSSALVDVPKENWGTRPAVVLDIVDRITFQALVDRSSIDLVGSMSPNVFGWRLPAVSPTAGVYSHNSKQWDRYRGHLGLLAGRHTVALQTDLVSFFASIPAATIQEAIQDRCRTSVPTSRLNDMVGAFAVQPHRSGLPQRSTASAVLANMFLEPLDDVLNHNSTQLPVMFGSRVRYRSFTRWMDDIWLFGNHASAARRAQMELQSAAQPLGLNLNSAKTNVFEGDDVAEKALQVEHSAVDDAIEKHGDFQPLEELVDRILAEPEKLGRTSVKFAAKRMRENNRRYRVQDLLLAANRMPHASDAWARLFRDVFTSPSLQDWYLDYAASDWATHEWSVAQFGRMFPSSRAPQRRLREFFASAIRDANTSLPLLALACQRLGAWDPVEARSAYRDAFRRAASPHARRVLALSSLGAGETRTQVRTWLTTDPENAPTLAMLEHYGFHGPKVQTDYAK
jgi:hypothetical protein